MRSTSNASLILFLGPVSFELVCLCTLMRNESSSNARADVRTPNCPPSPSCVLAYDRFLWEPARWLRRWTVNGLEFHDSLSLLKSITLFKRFVGCIYRNLRELCTTLQFAVLLVSPWTRNTPTFAVCRIVRKLEHCAHPKSITKKTLTLRVVWLGDKN